jgi:steroid 5-alpha reductase family enzyme
MNTVIDVLPFSALVIAGFMLFVWMLSLILKDASIVDFFWGLGFIAVAAANFTKPEAPTNRSVMVLVLTLIWGLRLAVYIYIRNRGKGEDFRYQAMRRKYGRRFGIVSLFTVFLFQGLILGIVSLPIQISINAAAPDRLVFFDYFGALVFMTGWLFETVADWQLFVFKSDPQNKGLPLQSGLWRYSQHPNYFGESLIWVGLFIIAFSVHHGILSIASPLLMFFLLLKVSGIPLLKKQFEKRPAYNEYMSKTSAFIPMPPKHKA